MGRTAAGGVLLPILLLFAGALALGSFVTTPAAPRGLTEDERDYLAAASNLARHGVFASAPPAATPPAADAYREPGYPALLALTWRVTGLPAPATGAELQQFARNRRASNLTRALHALLLLATAVAAGALGARFAGRIGGALAFALVAASPGLRAGAGLVAAENLAAPLLLIATLALVAAVEGSTLAALVAGAAFGALALTRASATVAITAAALVLAFATARKSEAGRLGSFGRLALFLAASSLPVLAWQARNFERLGHFVLADRGGLALAVRAELDRDVDRHGALAAALVWTPLEAARAAGERRAPDARFDRPTWSGEGNFFSRVVAPWRAERRSGGDSLALDARLRRASLAAFAEHPVAHLAATAAVSWRALFVERSPAWTAPVDLRFALGLLLAASTVAAAVAAGRALRAGDPRLVALLAPTVALFAIHALATEYLPRYALPLLPVAWSALALVVCGGAGLRSGPAPARD